MDRSPVASTVWRSVVAALGLALLVVAAPPAAYADPRDDLERADQEAAEAAAILEHATEQAREAAQSYAAASAELPAAEKRRDETRGQVAAAQVAANAAAVEAERADAALAAADERFQDSVDDVERARGQVDAFVVAAYKGSGFAAVNMLLQARGPVEVADRFGYLDHVVAAEREAVAELTTTRLQARQAENEAQLAKEQADEARRATAAALARAEAAEAEAERAATEAAQLSDARAEALAVAEAERDESLRRYEQAEAEAARVEAELRDWEAARQTGSAPPSRSGGSGAMFLMPTQGWQSSPFGMRFDPFFRVWQMHGGMDIAAAGGAPIYAAADGQVMRAGWYGGYGVFTCLSHGNYQGQGMSTCYAHQSEALVSPGQQVRRGDLIGRVGTTGASTGNHLHFEVRLDGSPTDPSGYLPSCLC